MSLKMVFETTKNATLSTVYAEMENKKLYIHSKYDPLREAALWAEQVYDKEKDTYVIFGMGLMYHINALLDKVDVGVEILLIEPEKTISRFAMKEGLMDKAVESNNVSFRININENDLDAELKNFFLEKNIVNLCFCSFPIYEKLYPKYFQKLMGAMRYMLDQKEFYINTKERFSIEHAQNITANIYEISQSTPIDCFMNRFEGCAAVLVSAGPSLEKNIDRLRGMDKNVIIITGGRTLKPLLDRGITPHFVVTADPSLANFRLFKDVLDCGVPMVTMWICNKYIINEYQGEKIFTNGTEIEDLDIELFGKTITELYASGTVSTLQLEFARWLGCKNIALIGQDLTDTDGKTHADMAAHEEDNHEIHIKRIKVKGNTEEYVYTHEIFKNYLESFEWYMQQTKDEITVFNCTEGGAYIEGTIVDALQHFLDEFGQTPRDFTTEIAEIIQQNKNKGQYRSLKEIYPYLKDMQRAVVKNYKLAEEALKIVQRSLDKEFVEDKDLKRLSKIDREISSNEQYTKISNTLSVRTIDNIKKIKLDKSKENKEQIVDILKLDRAIYLTVKGTCKAYSIILASILHEYKKILDEKIIN